jgi:ankyrin repeat protein
MEKLLTIVITATMFLPTAFAGNKPLIGKKIMNASETLAKCVMNNDIPCAKEALKRGADVNFFLRGGGSLSVLTLAARYADTAMVRLLLDNKADIDLQDKFGRTVLMGNIPPAYGRISSDMTKFLLDNCAKTNSIVDQNGRDALYWAAFLDDADKVELLLDYGADNFDLTDDSRSLIKNNICFGLQPCENRERIIGLIEKAKEDAAAGTRKIRKCKKA